MRYFILFLVVLFNFAGVTLAQDVPDTKDFASDGVINCYDVNSQLATMSPDQSIINDIMEEIGQPCFTWYEIEKGATLPPNWVFFSLENGPFCWVSGERTLDFVLNASNEVSVINPAQTITQLSQPLNPEDTSALTNWEGWSVWTFDERYYGAVDTTRWDSSTCDINLQTIPSPTVDLMNEKRDGFTANDNWPYRLLPSGAAFSFTINEGREITISRVGEKLIVDEPAYGVQLTWEIPASPGYVRDYTFGLMFWVNEQKDTFVALPDWAVLTDEQPAIISHTELLSMDLKALQCVSFQHEADMTQLIKIQLVAVEVEPETPVTTAEPQTAPEPTVVINELQFWRFDGSNYVRVGSLSLENATTVAPWLAVDAPFPGVFYKRTGDTAMMGWTEQVLDAPC